MEKTTVIYEGHDPNRENVTHVAVQSMTDPPYVWRTYSVRQDSDFIL